MPNAVTRIPEKGLDPDKILQTMKDYGQDDANYKDARTWSLVYYLGEEHTDFLKKAYGQYFSENGLNPMAFQSLRRFEYEVVRMAVHMLNGGPEAVGTMTSGGTESCLLSVKTYRDLARARRPWIRHPEMVAPETIHVAFEKGAEYFGLKLRRAPVGQDGRVNLKAYKRLINRNTVALFASAPNYPHGMVDPIEEIAAIARKKKLPFHVDGCLGGFFLPWVEKLGYPIPPFDFRVEGVTSMSADIHKYGYAAKGASVVLYRNMDYMKHQMFVYESWSGGVYASPALLGTRPGGSIAAAWATLNRMGEEGYLERAKVVMETTRRLMNGIRAIPELDIVGSPQASVFAYRSNDPDLDIYAVADVLEERGWNVDRQQNPEALHAMVTPQHEKIVDQYLSDLNEAVTRVKAHPEMAASGNAAMYGMIAHIPVRSMIKKEVLKIMMQMYGPSGVQPDLSSADQAEDLATRAGLAFVKAKKEIKKRLGL